MDKEKAIEAIKNVCDWLKSGANGAISESNDIYESIPADLARRFASELLKSANADGEGGCSLCQR